MNAYLFDDQAGDRRRADGQERVRFNSAEWTKRALAQLAALALRQPEINADDLASALHRAMIGEPHHPNAYGALWSQAEAAGIVSGTNRTVKSRRIKSRSRRILVWESRLFRGCFSCGPRGKLS